MPKRHRRLFARIVAIENLRAAYRSTADGKRGTLGYLVFKEEAEANLAGLRAELAAGTYQPQPLREFYVTEPKRRLISAMSFRDRVVQHALCAVISPLFDRTLSPRCQACRVGHGTHRAADELQAELRGDLARYGEVYFLKTDFRAFFASINRARLWQEIERKIGCRDTLALIERFTPRDGTGLPIGNLTSQLWANVYGAIFDRQLTALGCRHWQRYMDDVVILDDGRGWRRLITLLDALREYARSEMRLELSRWMVANWQRGVNFVGYRIWPTHRLLRRSSVRRARRSLRHFARSGDAEGRRRFLGAWLGHARHASSAHLLRSLHLSIPQPA